MCRVGVQRVLALVLVWVTVCRGAPAAYWKLFELSSEGLLTEESVTPHLQVVQSTGAPITQILANAKIVFCSAFKSPKNELIQARFHRDCSSDKQARQILDSQ